MGQPAQQVWEYLLVWMGPCSPSNDAREGFHTRIRDMRILRILCVSVRICAYPFCVSVRICAYLCVSCVSGAYPRILRILRVSVRIVRIHVRIRAYPFAYQVRIRAYPSRIPVWNPSRAS